MRCLTSLLGSLIYLSTLFPSAVNEPEDPCSVKKEWRKKTLVNLDDWLEKITPLPIRTFPLLNPKKTGVSVISLPELEAFVKNHGFFSCNKPLVGVVTEEEEDIEPIRVALSAISRCNSSFFVEFATAELLSKALAYRNLKVGMILSIPCVTKKKVVLTEYRVDQVLDLWHEMPAFGLLPLKKGSHPILLFRGTDLSLLSQKSWASILSDMDISGTGFSAFHFARSDIHNWLEKAFKSSGLKSKLTGFSLGGILSMYTNLFERSLVYEEGSIAFNPPGFSESISKRWKDSSFAQKIYVTQGDLIPKLGVLVPPAFVLFEEKNFSPIEAHTKFISGGPFRYGEISIEKEKPPVKE